MGQSATAKLRYGVILGGESGWQIEEYDADAYELGGSAAWLEDDDEDGEGVEGKIEKRLLAAAGFTETDYRVDGYFARKEAALATYGAEVDRFGTWDYSDYALVLRKPDLHVNWGVGAIEMPSVPVDGRAYLAAVCGLIGITPTTEPSWLLGALYG